MSAMEELAMCKNCKQAVKPGNADLVLDGEQYVLVHALCEYQLNLPLPTPPDPGEPGQFPQLED